MTEAKGDLIAFLELMCGLQLADWQKQLIVEWQGGNAKVATLTDGPTAKDEDALPKTRVAFADMTRDQLRAHYKATLSTEDHRRVFEACVMILHLGGDAGLDSAWTDKHWPDAKAVRNLLYKNVLARKGGGKRLHLTDAGRVLINE